MTTGSMKVYTRTGDQGSTSLFGGKRVSKSDPRLDAYGTLDELNSVLGLLVAEIEHHRPQGHAAIEMGRIVNELRLIQAQLFTLGSHLATEDEGMRSKLPVLSAEDVGALETWMDRMSVDLEPLKNFILPGGTKAASVAHLARTIARRAERAIVALGYDADWFLKIVQHTNRLNDYFFVLARHLNRLDGVTEPTWTSKNSNK